MTRGFDYRHRPAKNIERHLIVDACRRFINSAPGIKPQYVGMGALEFIDFELMHRSLNISRMYSIERSDPTRFEFNKPFKTISIVSGTTSEVLQGNGIDLKKPTIIWLDYTETLNSSIISDSMHIGRTLSAPSAWFITLNANPSNPIDDRLERLTEMVGSDYVPPGLKNSDLGGAGLASVQRSILSAVIANALQQRSTPARWQQIINLRYRDNALMQTLGGLILPAHTNLREVTDWFIEADFYTPDEDALDLRVPVITPRERAVLDRQLPKRSQRPLRLAAVPPSDLEAYRRVYRYLHLAGLQSAAETTWTT